MKICEECSKEFEAVQKVRRYCSRSCSATANNRGRRRHGEQPRECIRCTGPVVSKIKGEYCTTACRQAHEIELWIDGKLDGCWKYSHAGYVRRYLEDRSGGVCEMPDCDEQRVRADGSSILQVDHIDGNWRNNTVANVRLICPSCHALTETWGAANMGKGRTWKSQYNQFSPLPTGSGAEASIPR